MERFKTEKSFNFGLNTVKSKSVGTIFVISLYYFIRVSYILVLKIYSFYLKQLTKRNYKNLKCGPNFKIRTFVNKIEKNQLYSRTKNVTYSKFLLSIFQHSNLRNGFGVNRGVYWIR